MVMTDGQRKKIAEVFTHIGAGARAGKRLIDAGATSQEVLDHLRALEELVSGVRLVVDDAIGAAAVLGHVQRAKTLTRPRTPR